MSKPIPLLAGLLALWLIATSAWYYRSGCCTIAAAATTAVEDATTATVATTTTASTIATAAVAATANINIQDASSFGSAAADNLSFAPSAHNYTGVLSDTLDTVFRETAAYLNEHPDRSIRITGKYSTNETNNSILATLGLGRANQVKKLLVDLGAQDGQIELADETVTQADTINGLLTNLVYYDFFETKAVDTNRLTDIEQRLRASPLTLYFDTDAKTIDLTDEQRQFFTDLTYYLSKKTNAGIRSTGHTDNRGEAKANRYLSRKRSEFVRDFLVQNGIQEEQIWVFYEGEDQPIADNETSEGRALNRRVEIALR
ncbi:MAG: OmpA family protein [Bacteroidota bacterium]